MTRPPRLPDLLVNFALTALRNDGLPKRVMSGYRPIYKARPDYWSSAHHEFVDGNGVETGENGQAEVWLLTPQAYPQAFWIGRRVEVAEGTRIVGQIEVLQILNPTLKLSDSANESPPALARQMEILAEKFMLERLIFWRDAQGSLRPLVQ